MKRFGELMRAPGIYIRMLFATFVFFILCLFHYKSIITSLYYSVICIVLMQVGYVGGVLFLVWREAKSRRAR
ncbi:hypothetical protein ATY81_16965 [Rhizobium sp. R72]|nr:hypothetical protein ATY81_16965 [Rhizobium sp. R72]OWW04229.1 hypothetical protein ATY80_16965 [Rhizobium sp. R711]